jgi:hypothetical protein
MNLNNDDLPGVHKGMLLAMEERGTNVFFSPTPTGDLTLSRWSNSVATEMLSYELAMSTHQNHLLMLELMKSFRYNALRHDLRLRTHLLVQSPPGREKSDTQRKMEMCCPPEAVMSSDYSSALAVYTNKTEDYSEFFCDEAPSSIVGDPEKMSAQAREQRDREKTNLTKNYISYQRNKETADGKGREQERITKSHQVSKLMFCNHIAKMKDTSMLDRFRVLVLVNSKRSGVTLPQRVIGSQLVSEEAQIAQFAQTKRDEFLLVGMAINMCNVGAISPPNTDLFSYICLAGEQVLLRHMSWKVHETSSSSELTFLSGYGRACLSACLPGCAGVCLWQGARSDV